MAQDSFNLYQKFEIDDFARELSRLMANDPVCSCNVAGLVVQPDSSGGAGSPKFYADFGGGKSLNSASPTAAGCPTTIASERILAVAGQPLPQSRMSFKVGSIKLSQLTPSNVTLAAGTGPVLGTEYTGYIEVGFVNANGTSAVYPARTTKRFFVGADQKVIGCGAAPDLVTYSVSSTVAYNSADDLAPIETAASCAPGFSIVGGGWGGLAPPAGQPPLSGCDGPENAVVRYNRPGTDAGGVNVVTWNVLAKCHPVQAMAVCLKSGSNAAPSAGGP